MPSSQPSKWLPEGKQRQSLSPPRPRTLKRGARMAAKLPWTTGRRRSSSPAKNTSLAAASNKVARRFFSPAKSLLASQTPHRKKKHNHRKYRERRGFQKN